MIEQQQRSITLIMRKVKFEAREPIDLAFK